MSVIALVPMSSKNFKEWRPRAEAEYAQAQMKAFGYSIDEALEISKSSFERLLPLGVETKENFLYEIVEDAQVAGYLWVALKPQKKCLKAFIYDIRIQDSYQGRGVGRKAMLCLENEMKRFNVECIGLHVFSYNERAIHLYKALGYVTTDLVMEKSIN
jgi:ribosomal protein S18 acetylase RimI-like enzyme